MRATTWPVVPLCKRQLRDVRPEDILADGLYRKCNVYRGGGGYDHFPTITSSRLGEQAGDQFVAQLSGCPLRCPYCYVTRDGVAGAAVDVTTTELVDEFRKSGQHVFHLMGGAPALHLDKWPSLIDALPRMSIFTSDLMLVEQLYDTTVLENINTSRAIYAVSIKGTTPEEFKANTGVELDEKLFWRNFDAIVDADLSFYLTFTNCDPAGVDVFKRKLTARYSPAVLLDSFSIDLVHYDALNDELGGDE